MKYCCKQFTEKAKGHQAFVGGGLGYPDVPDAQFEQLEDGSWSINGCCGGGCFVVSNMKFCPFCGSNLTLTQTKKDGRKI